MSNTTGRLDSATLPSRKTAEALWTLTDLFPQFRPAYNVFQTSVNDPALIVHPVSSIARAANIPTPGIDAIVNLGAMANGEDYWSTGRTLEKL